MAEKASLRQLEAQTPGDTTNFKILVRALVNHQKGPYAILNGAGRQVGVALTNEEYALYAEIMRLLANPMELKLVLERNQQAKNGVFDDTISLLEAFFPEETQQYA